MEIKEFAVIQGKLISKLRAMLPSHLSLADVLSDVLDISNDSAYRRIRCESALSIDEIQKICTYFKISFDSLMSSDFGAASFSYSPVRNRDELLIYLRGIRDDMLKILASENNAITYVSFDVPIFHIFKQPEYFQFKVFYWMHSISKDPEFAKKKFSVNELDADIMEVSKELRDIYAQIPSVELWSDSIVNSFVKQLDYCWMAGLIASKEDVLILIDKVKESMEMVEREVEMNVKYLSNGLPADQKPTFQLYQCDIEIGNNTILVKMGENYMTYITYHTFNRMFTSNLGFCEQTQNWMSNLTRQSNLISGVALGQRYQFFKRLYNRLNNMKEKIEAE